MTAHEFNDKYKDFIEPGFDGLEFDDAVVTKLLDSLFKDFTRIPGFQFAQIKLKYGKARFYANLSANTTYLVEDAIDRILKVRE